MASSPLMSFYGTPLGRKVRQLGRHWVALGGPKGARAGLAAPAVVENDTRRPLAAVTFVWDEVDYLRAWLAYYGGQLGRDNLFVVAHGEVPEVLKLAEGCRIYGMPRTRVDKVFARRKSDMAEGLVSFLLTEYQTVIVGDVDEMVVIDPAVSGSLPDFVAANRQRNRSLKAFNLNLLDDPTAPPVDFDRPILAQRSLAHTMHHYCKPVIVSDRVSFGAGFHYSSHYPEIAEGAYLVHLHFADRAANARIAASRRDSFQQNPQLQLAEGRHKAFWNGHKRRFDKRIADTNEMPLHPLDELVPRYIAAMRGSITKKPGGEIVAPGWTMTYGKESEDVRIQIPERFRSVL